MINIKCPNKNQGFVCFLQKMLARKNCTKNFQSFSNIFFFYQQIKTIGVEGCFFICLYFIGADGDENLKIYLVWPYRTTCIYVSFQHAMFALRASISSMVYVYSSRTAQKVIISNGIPW